MLLVSDPESYAFIILRGPDIGYFANVLIGTPPQEFRLIADTGSADFWVGADLCDEVNKGKTTGRGCVSLSVVL